MPSRFDLLNDKEWLQERYVKEHSSTVLIAETLGCSSVTVVNALHRIGIPLTHKYKRRMAIDTDVSNMLNDVMWLRQKYLIERLSTAQIGKMLGCNHNTVNFALRRGKILVRSRHEVRSRLELNDVLWLHEKYETEGMSITQIGGLLMCSRQTVSSALRRGGICLRHPRRASIDHVKLNDALWLHQRYEVERLSTLQIGKIVNCSPNTVASALRRGGIHVKTISETLKGLPAHNRGKPHSEEHKQKLRIARRSRRFRKHSTRPELQFEAICAKNNLPFEFTGDGKVWIGKKGGHSINPDFIGRSNGKRFAVFVNGDYWHSQLLRPQLRETQRPEFQVSHSKKHRWVPIILWETDLKREDAEAFVLATLEKVGFSVPR